jgi:hypothetical protein
MATRLGFGAYGANQAAADQAAALARIAAARTTAQPTVDIGTPPSVASQTPTPAPQPASTPMPTASNTATAPGMYAYPAGTPYSGPTNVGMTSTTYGGGAGSGYPGVNGGAPVYSGGTAPNGSGGATGGTSQAPNYADAYRQAALARLNKVGAGENDPMGAVQRDRLYSDQSDANTAAAAQQQSALRRTTAAGGGSLYDPSQGAAEREVTAARQGAQQGAKRDIDTKAHELNWEAQFAANRLLAADPNRYGHSVNVYGSGATAGAQPYGGTNLVGGGAQQPVVGGGGQNPPVQQPPVQQPPVQQPPADNVPQPQEPPGGWLPTAESYYHSGNGGYSYTAPEPYDPLAGANALGYGTAGLDPQALYALNLVNSYDPNKSPFTVYQNNTRPGSTTPSYYQS